MVFLYGFQRVLAQTKAGIKKRLIVLVRSIEILNQAQQGCAVKCVLDSTRMSQSRAAFARLHLSQKHH